MPPLPATEEVLPSDVIWPSLWSSSAPTVTGATSELQALAPAVSSTVQTEDTFTAANGTAISGRTPSPTTTSGATWSTSGGGWDIQSNAARCPSTSKHTAIVDSGEADVHVTCDVTWGKGTGDGEWTRLVVRAISTTDLLAFGPWGQDGTSSWRLVDEHDNTVASWASSKTAVEGATDTVAATCSENVLTFVVGGVSIGSYTLGGSSVGTGKRVLIVTWSAGASAYDLALKAMLEGNGHQVTIALESATEVLSTSTPTYDVVIVSDLCDQAVLGAKYDGQGANSLPVIHCCAARWQSNKFVASGVVADGDTGVLNTVYEATGADFAWTGQVDDARVPIVTINSHILIGHYCTASLPASAAGILRRPASTNHFVAWSFAAGDNNSDSSATFAARTMTLGWSAEILGYLNAAGEQFLEDAIAWCTASGGGTGTSPHATATRYGMQSNELQASPTGRWDNFKVTQLDATIGNSYIQAAAAGVTRAYMMVPNPPTVSAVIEWVQVRCVQYRSGAGLWSARLVAEDDNGDLVLGPAIPAPTDIPTTSTSTERYLPMQTGTVHGTPWDTFAAGRLGVLVESVTSDADAAFGDARLIDLYLRVRWNQAPAVYATILSLNSAVTDSGMSPQVGWTYSDVDGDPQVAYQVRCWPTAQYVDPDTSPWYDSGRVWSGLARTHRVGRVLPPATAHTVAVRAWQRDINGREVVSDWSTVSYTTPAALHGTPAFTATADNANAEIDLASSNVYAADYVVVERAASGASGTDPDVWELLDVAAPTTAGTILAGDTFTRADSTTIGTTEVGSEPWTESGTGGDVSIVSGRVYLTGNMSISVDVDQWDVAVRCVADVSQATLHLYGRLATLSGWARVELAPSGQVSLAAYDLGLGSETFRVATYVTLTDPTATRLEIRCVGDQYYALVDGVIVLYREDATVAAGVKVGELKGIGCFNGGVGSYADDFEVERMNRTFAYRDVAAPQGKAWVHRLTPYLGDDRRTRIGDTPVTTTPAVTLTPTRWWLKDPDDPAASIAIRPTEIGWSHARPGAVILPVGSGQVPSFSELRGAVFDVTARVTTEAAQVALDTMLRRQSTLVLLDVLGRSWRVRLASQVAWDIDVTPPATGSTYPIGHVHTARFALAETTDATPTWDD